MTPIVAGLYSIQIAAVVYMLIVWFDVMRKFTFFKNMEWVKENPTFALRFAKSPRWPIVGCGLMMGTLFLFFGLKGSYLPLFWSRFIGLCSMTFFSCLIYGLMERRLRSKIPLSKERSASLLQKNIRSYISKNLVRTSYAAIAVLALAYIASIFARKISVATFAGDIVFQILVDGICLGTIWYVVRERVPHKKALGPAVGEDLGKLYKVINIKLCSLLIVFYSALALIELAMQWHGYEIPSPLAPGWYKVFHESRPPLPIISQSIWDIIMSALSIPLFLYLANNKLVREIRTMDFSTHNKDGLASI